MESQASTDRAKKPYATPRLTVHGTVQRLTEGGAGPTKESNPAMSGSKIG